MTDTTSSPMIDRVRSARRRINACLEEEMRELGADPTGETQQAMSLSGLEFFERWVQPEMPPPPSIVVLFGMEWVELEPSRVVLSLDPSRWMLNPIGSIHGGIAATLLDTVLGTAVHTTLPAGTGYATTDLHMRYLRPMNADTGRVLATGEVVHRGRRQATAEGRVEVEATGKLIATGTAGCTIIQP
jgi:uncharacterized protein (TIGR00369 family)